MDNDQFVFQEIYDVFQPKILRYLKHLVGEDEAEDLSQEVFIRVSQALDNFRGESKLSNWLYRIATNIALDRLRSPSFQRVLQKGASSAPAENVDTEIEDRIAFTGEKKPLLEHQVYRREMNECIQEYIAKLPENYRTVLVLSELEGLRNEEITEILGLSLHTVKIRLHRGRVRLKQELEDHCDSYWIENNEFVPELKRTKK